MAVFSLRQAAAVGDLSGRISLARDIYGYRRGHLPTDPVGVGARMSLRDWAAIGLRTSFNLNVIAVGIESFTDSMFDEVDTAVARMREVYGAIGIGIKWVWHWQISTADADGLDVITSEDDVDDLLSGWIVDENAGIDLYFPAAWNPQGPDQTLLGKSALPGPCPGEKDGKGKNGSCVGLTGKTFSSRSASHEIGHYLSLKHRDEEPQNIMCPTKFAASPTWQAVGFDDDQATDVKRHCMVLKIWSP